jgi:hypothetical protein
MFDPMDSEAAWLNITNIVLGAITFMAFAVVVTVAFREVVARVRSRATLRLTDDDHAFLHDSLGLTMADGGERLAVPPTDASSKKAGVEGKRQAD